MLKKILLEGIGETDCYKFYTDKHIGYIFFLNPPIEEIVQDLWGGWEKYEEWQIAYGYAGPVKILRIIGNQVSYKYLTQARYCRTCECCAYKPLSGFENVPIRNIGCKCELMSQGYANWIINHIFRNKYYK